MNQKRIAVYPGTFDPITYGHIDIIRRALNVVDVLIVAVADDSIKDPLFSLKDRAALATEALKKGKVDLKRIRVVAFKGLLVDFAAKQKATVLVRGLRAVSDFEYEFQMACMNTKLAPSIETIFLPASDTVQFISSRFVKEIARLGGEISCLVPPVVEKALLKKFR